MGNKTSSLLLDEEIRVIRDETGFSPAQIEALYARFRSLDKSGICGSLSRQDFLRVPELAINPLCDRIVHMFFVNCDDDHERINFRQFMKVLATFRSSTSRSHNQQPQQRATGTSNQLQQSQQGGQRQQQHLQVPKMRKDSVQAISSNMFLSNKHRTLRHSRHSSCDGFFNYYHTTNQHSVHYVASTNHLAYNLMDPDEPPNSRKQKLFFMFKIYDVDQDNLISLDDIKKILHAMVGNYISQFKLDDMAYRILQQVDKNSDGYLDFDEFCTAFLHRDINDSLKVNFSFPRNSSSQASPAASSSTSSSSSSPFKIYK